MTARQLLRRGPGLRLRARWLLGAVLTLVGVLAPVDAPELPGPLDGPYGAAPAHAQTPNVIAGTPDNCPQDSTDTRSWTVDPNDASRCLLERPACAENPAKSGEYLTPSTEFPDFCEATILQSVDATAYTTCLGLTGVVIKTATAGQCRIIQSTQCEPGLNRVGFNKCLRVERRTWTCTAGTTRRNEFNTCYRPPPVQTGTHPACGVGAPDFDGLPLPCDEYVGDDFVRTPGSVLCSSYTTGEARSQPQALAANAYWCRYDTRFLDIACHAAGATCTAAYALCLKRASGTGGCAAVANTIRCRSLQADYGAGSKTAAEVYAEGCAPCVVLPFQPVSPDCPTELHSGPWPVSRNQTHDALRFKADFNWADPQCQADVRAGTLSSACLNLSTCADPPRGQLVSESSHHSRAAIVNSPITLRVEGAPSRTRTVHQYITSRSNPPISRTRWGYRYFEYPDATPTDPTIRTWSRPNAGTSYTDVSVITQGGECRVRDWPEFRIIVEELWPDTDEAAIVALFGADSLAFWRNLPAAEKRSRTEARGLVFIDSTTPQRDKDNEIMRRAGALTQELRCNHGANVWCVWTPRRSGFFRLKAAGGWHMTRTGNRLWVQPHNRVGLENFFMNLAPSDGNCLYSAPRDRHYWRRNEDADCILLNLQEMGLTPADVGLESDLSGLLPNDDPGNEWLFTAAASEKSRCQPRDLRVTCRGSGESVNYTESEPIGVLVHEVRINTVTTSP